VGDLTDCILVYLLYRSKAGLLGEYIYMQGISTAAALICSKGISFLGLTFCNCFSVVFSKNNNNNNSLTREETARYREEVDRSVVIK
jgi:hypothetical protein